VLFVLVDQRFALSKSANNFLKVSPRVGACLLSCTRMETLSMKDLVLLTRQLQKLRVGKSALTIV